MYSHNQRNHKVKTLKKLVILSSIPLLTLTQVSLADHHGQTCPLSYKFYKLNIAKQTGFTTGQLDQWMKNTIKYKYGQDGGLGKCWFSTEPLQDACMSIPGVGPKKASGYVCQIWITDGKSNGEKSIQWCNDWKNIKNLNIGVYPKGTYADCSKTIIETCGAKAGDTCSKICKNKLGFIPTTPAQTICTQLKEKGLNSIPDAFKNNTSCACAGTPLRNKLNRVSNYLWPEVDASKFPILHKVVPPGSKDMSIPKKN